MTSSIFSFKDYTISEPTNTSFSSYQPSTAWQPSTSSGSSYWTNQVPSNNLNTSSPTSSSAVQNVSPTRSPGSPNYAASSPSATFINLTPQTQNYHPPASEVYQPGGSPHYSASSQPPVVPVHPNPQLYYPSSLSPTHQIYGNVISPTGFGTGFAYGTTGWHGASDYGLFQSTYHYQPAEYIPIINEAR